MYDILLEKNKFPIYKYFQKWQERLKTSIEMNEYYDAFTVINKLTDVVKLRDFQYRLLLGKNFLNDILFKWKKVNLTTCEICNEDKVQTLVHLFAECKVTKNIWETMRELIGCLDKCCWDKKAIILNKVHPKTMSIINFIVLVTRQLIFRCKYQGIKVNLRIIKQELEFYFLREQQKALKASNSAKTSEKVLKRWNPVLHLLSDSDPIIL